MNSVPLSNVKRIVFSKAKEIKGLHEGAAVYAAHASVQIDAEVEEKDRF